MIFNDLLLSIVLIGMMYVDASIEAVVSPFDDRTECDGLLLSCDSLLCMEKYFVIDLFGSVYKDVGEIAGIELIPEIKIIQ